MDIKQKNTNSIEILNQFTPRMPFDVSEFSRDRRRVDKITRRINCLEIISRKNIQENNIYNTMIQNNIRADTVCYFEMLPSRENLFFSLSLSRRDKPTELTRSRVTRNIFSRVKTPRVSINRSSGREKPAMPIRNTFFGARMRRASQKV